MVLFKFQKKQLLLKKWADSQKRTGLYWTSHLGFEVFKFINTRVNTVCDTCSSHAPNGINRKCKVCGSSQRIQNYFSRNELIKEGISEYDLDNLRHITLFHQNRYYLDHINLNNLLK